MSKTEISPQLLRFFEAEWANESTMRRDNAECGDTSHTYDPDDELYIPRSSLATALDSWWQADDSIRAAFIGCYSQDKAEAVAAVRAAEAELKVLIERFGADTLLEDLA